MACAEALPWKVACLPGACAISCGIPRHKAAHTPGMRPHTESSFNSAPRTKGDHTMNNAQIGLAYNQFKKIGPALFQRLYVGMIKHQAIAGVQTTSCATYVVEDSTGRCLFYKTVDIKTGQMVRGGNDLVAYPSALQALDEHFNDAFVAKDGLVEMTQYCAEAHMFKPGSMKLHPEYGQEVYHADIDELDMSNDGFIDLHAMRARLQAQGK